MPAFLERRRKSWEFGQIPGNEPGFPFMAAGWTSMGGWVKLGVDTSSPYIDGRPLAVAGVPETREYLARGIIDDEEIGIASDIVSVTFAG